MSLCLIRLGSENQEFQVPPALAFLLACASVLLGVPQATQAETIGIEDFSGSETVVDFSSQVVPQTPDPIVFGDLTIDSDVSDLRVTELYDPFAETPLASMGPYLGDLLVNAPSEIELRFATPVTRVGMWINGGNSNTSWTLTGFDLSGTPVGSHVFHYVSVDYPDPSTFAGIEFSTPLARVTIVETLPNRQFTSIDDIRFEFSAPVSVHETTWSRLKGRFR